MDLVGRGLPLDDLLHLFEELAGFDISLLLPVDKLLPAGNVKLYTDFVGEDEAGGLPSNFGKLYGIKIYDIFKKGRTDLTVE